MPDSRGCISPAASSDALGTARPSASVRLVRPRSYTDGCVPAGAAICTRKHGDCTGSAKKQCTWGPSSWRSPKVIPAGAPHPARQIDEQRMFGIHHDALLRQLPAQVQGRGAVPQQQRKGAFVVHEMAERVGLRLAAPRSHGALVVARMLHHLDTPGGAGAPSSTPWRRRTCAPPHGSPAPRPPRRCSGPGCPWSPPPPGGVRIPRARRARPAPGNPVRGTAALHARPGFPRIPAPRGCHRAP